MMSGGRNGGTLTAEKPREFFCERCQARCTRSRDGSTEYGHRRGCPRRPDEFGWVDGPAYDPATDQRLATDGGADRD